MSSKKKKKHIKHEIDESVEDNFFKHIKLNIKDFKLTEKQKNIVTKAFDKNTNLFYLLALLRHTGRATPRSREAH